MKELLTLHLTTEDIADAKRYGFGSALLCQLASRTGTLWRLAADGTALEIMKPFRRANFWIDGHSDVMRGNLYIDGLITTVQACAEIHSPEESHRHEALA